MRYYLDTNILEFMRNSRNTDLHNDIYSILSDYSNILLTSSVCVHEFLHLAHIGKLGKDRKSKQAPNAEDILEWIDNAGIEIISVNRLHLRQYASLPLYGEHRDPNDRLIVAQAICDHIPLISSDHKFSSYERFGLKFILNER